MFNATNVVATLLGKDVEAAFGSVGLASTSVREKLIELSGGLETFAAQAEFYMQNFLTEAERTAYATDNLKIAFSDLGLTMPTTRDAFRSLVEGLDLTTEAGMKMYASLMNLAPGFVALTTNTEALAQALAQAAWEATEALLNNAQTALESAKGKLEEAESNLKSAYESEAALLQSTIDKFKSFAKSLREFQKSLFTSDLTALTIKQQYSTAKDALMEVAARAKAGDETAFEDLQGVSEDFLEVSRAYSSDFVQYQKDFKTVSSILNESASSAEQQAGVAEQQLDALIQLVSGYITINSSILSVAAAISALSKAQLDYKQVATTPLPSLSSSENIVYNWFTETLGRAPKMEGLKFWSGAIDTGNNTLSGLYEDFVEAAVRNGETFVDGSHASGLDYVPFDGYVAELHKGERVQTAASVAKEEQLQAVIASLAETIAAGNRAIAQNTLDTAKQLRRWDGDGLPEVRSEV